ncbi:MAG: carboxypeptidase-like regulatory domain-containing protein, partial [Acidobacteriota bacterium]
VVDGAGRPVDGTVVMVSVMEPDKNGRRLWIHRVGQRSDADGRARLLLPRLTTRGFLFARAPLGDDVWLPLEPTAVDQPRVELKVPAVDTETVRLTSRGRPAAGAILAMSAGVDLVPIARADRRGHLRYPLVDAEQRRHWLIVHDGGMTLWRDGQHRPGDTPEAEPDAPPTLDLPPTRVLLGRVIDTERLPVADALIWDVGNPATRARTAGDGSFQIVPFTSGPRTTIAVAGTDHMAQHLAPPLPDPLPDVVLRPAAMLRARVVDPDDRPVADARVAFTFRGSLQQLQSRPNPFAQGTTQTGEDGRLTLRQLIPGGRYEVQITGRGFAETRFDLQAESSTEELVWRLTRGRSLSGRVVDADGQAVRGADVRVDSEGADHAAETRQATTGDDGHFTIDRVTLNGARVVVEARGFAEGTWRLGESVDRQPIDLGDLMLDSGTTLVGKVLDADGEGLGSAIVSGHIVPDGRGSTFRSFHETTDATGRFTLADLPDRGRLELSAYSQSTRASGSAAVDLPAERVTLRVAAFARVGGRVLDAEGAPVAQADVTLSITSADGSMRASTTGTGGDGRFGFESVEAGRVTLDARGADARARSVTLDVASGQVLDDVTLRLTEGGATLTGLVHDPDGVGISGAHVVVGQMGSAPITGGPMSAQTDLDGRFELSGLTPDLAMLVVRTSDGRHHERRIDLANGTQDVRIELAGTIRLAGVVVDAEGTPVAGVAISALGDDLPQRDDGSRPRTDASGHFDLAAVPTPVRGLHLERAGAVPHRVHFDRLPGGPIEQTRDDLELVLPAGARLEGVVQVRPSDRGGVQVDATCRRAGERWPIYAVTRLDAEGRFAFEGLSSCDWAVYARLGLRSERQVVRVATDDTLLRADFTLAEGFSIRGVVTLDGDPLAKAWLSIRGESGWAINANTDQAGRFRADDALAGLARIRIGHPDLGGVRQVDAHLVGDDEIVVPLTSAPPE